MLMSSAFAVMAAMMWFGPGPACGAATPPGPWRGLPPAGWRRQPLQGRADGHFIHHEEPGALFTLQTHHQGFPGNGGAGPQDEPFFHSLPERFRGPQRPLPAPARPSGTPPRPGPHPGGPHDVKGRPQLQAKPPHPAKQHGSPSEEKQVVANEGSGGCRTKEGFYFSGQKWYVKGCRRRTCVHFRGSFITETDSCDSEIFNTTYKCIVQVDTTAQYPDCCPTYRCNPDNLGNSVK